MRKLFQFFVQSKAFKPVLAATIAAAGGALYVTLIIISGMHQPVLPLWVELLAGAIAGEVVLLIAVLVEWLTPKVQGFLQNYNSVVVAFGGAIAIALSGAFLAKVGRTFVEGGEGSGTILVVLGWLIGTIGSLLWFAIWFFGKPRNDNNNNNKE